MTGDFPGTRLVVVGLRVVGEAVVRAAQARGCSVVAVDDRPTDATRSIATTFGVDLFEAPGIDELRAIVAAADTVVLSPGIPDAHPIHAVAAAAGVPIASEYDLAAVWDDRPCVAVTGTDGKTTVTTMVTDVLRAAGRRAVLAGNAEVPLVAAIADDAAELFVVEASSFGLGVSRRFAPRVATWLNLAPDHQDAHLDMAHYGAAKARIWANLGVEDVAVANADDPAVAARAAALIERGVHVQTFGRAADAGWHVADGMLCSPDGVAFVAIEDLPRAFPHDVANLLAVAATATAAGAPLEAVASVARAFRGLPHRVVLVGEAEGVRYYDDSKATAPHATLAALRGFESVVLIAGGHNKGLDLSALAAGAPHVRGVVAIGAAAAEIVAAFEGLRPVSVATSMDEAVAQARSQARPGDAVLLSPGCASFDWYGSYAERGDDFIRAVRSMVEVSS